MLYGPQGLIYIIPGLINRVTTRGLGSCVWGILGQRGWELLLKRATNITMYLCVHLLNSIPTGPH